MTPLHGTMACRSPFAMGGMGMGMAPMVPPMYGAPPPQPMMGAMPMGGVSPIPNPLPSHVDSVCSIDLPRALPSTFLRA
jgi:hypothetical protein